MAGFRSLLAFWLGGYGGAVLAELPAWRTLTVAATSRTLTVASAPRTLTVVAFDRTYEVPCG